VDAPFPLAGEASAALSSLCWAVAGVLFVGVRTGVSGITVNFGKNVTGVLCFGAALLLLHGSPVPRGLNPEALALLVASGFVGLTICDSLLFRAYMEIGPRRANVIMAAAPAIAALLAVFPPLGEVPPALTWTGMGVCFLGILLAVLERAPDPVGRDRLRRGTRDALAAAFFQAVGLLLARRGFQVAAVDTASGAAVRLVSGMLGMVALGLLTRRLAGWTRQLTTHGTWRRVAGAAVLGTFLGIWSNQAGLAWARHTGVAATLNALAPVWLIPLSAAVLGERHDARAWISTALAVGGIALMVFA
jgi:drug/metabolite transporter (DMT)-like permease